MTCSRCHSTKPNSECYVCATDEPDEPDAFRLAKDADFEHESDRQPFSD